jgi:uncharacterized sulfatase
MLGASRRKTAFPGRHRGWEFYDLQDDPHEMSSQYSNPEYREIASRLKAQLKQVRSALEETDERFPGIQAIIDAHWQQ